MRLLGEDAVRDISSDFPNQSITYMIDKSQCSDTDGIGGKYVFFFCTIISAVEIKYR